MTLIDTLDTLAIIGNYSGYCSWYKNDNSPPPPLLDFFSGVSKLVFFMYIFTELQCILLFKYLKICLWWESIFNFLFLCLEFRAAVQRIVDLVDFDKPNVVQVFEANIRNQFTFFRFILHSYTETYKTLEKKDYCWLKSWFK